jgi:hypothetical protein
MVLSEAVCRNLADLRAIDSTVAFIIFSIDIFYSAFRVFYTSIDVQFSYITMVDRKSSAEGMKISSKLWTICSFIGHSLNLIFLLYLSAAD